MCSNSGILLFVATVVIKILVVECKSYYNESCVHDCLEDQLHDQILSRRKRFIIFPDGSSFQLVFCVQTSALIPIGDIFLYGNTAALAWTLPSDPSFLYKLKDFENAGSAQRRQDVQKNIYYLDDKGKLLAKVPYKRKPIINPVFAKRSIDELTFKEKLKMKINITRMHERQYDRRYLSKVHMDEQSIEFHRTNRVELFEKVEKLLSALGQDGRQCLLHKLCESAQKQRQGTFLQEFMRVVFTLPKGRAFDKEHHQAYDEAHKPATDCQRLYPGCENFQYQM